MRVLHTSDWHVGRTFHGYSTLPAVAQVLAAIPQAVREHRVDVVIVAGDVYDLTNPSTEAVGVLQQALTSILDAGAQVIVTSGNHDSAVRLGFAGPFTRSAGLHLATDAAAIRTPIEIHDDHGPVDFYALPYLQPELVRHLPWAPGAARTQRDVITAAMDQVRATIRERASDHRRTVAIAHTFVAGAEGESSDSERAITRAPLIAGGVDAVPATAFDGVDYVALGHIHGNSTLAAHIRYSGALLHYSFKEAGKPRGGWLVDLDGDGLKDTKWLDLPIPRPLTEIRGEFDHLLTHEKWEPVVKHYVRAVYLDRNKQVDPMRRLRERFEFAAEVVHEPLGGVAPTISNYAEQVRGKDDTEVFAMFLADVRNQVGPDDAELALFAEIKAQRDAQAEG